MPRILSRDEKFQGFSELFDKLTNDTTTKSLVFKSLHPIETGRSANNKLSVLIRLTSDNSNGALQPKVY